MYLKFKRKIKRIQKLSGDRLAKLAFLGTPKLQHKDVYSGASVAIVGPASDLAGSFLGPRIDKHDIVVKFNRMIGFERELDVHYGSRCDHLYHGLLPGLERGRCGAIEPKRWKELGVKLVIYPFSLGVESYRSVANYYIEGKFQGAPCARIPKDLCDYWEMKILARPTSGFMAIAMAASGGAKEINIFGFSFFSTPHHGSYFNDGSMENVNAVSYFHNPSAERGLLPRLTEMFGTKINVM